MTFAPYNLTEPPDTEDSSLAPATAAGPVPMTAPMVNMLSPQTPQRPSIALAPSVSVSRGCLSIIGRAALHQLHHACTISATLSSACTIPRPLHTLFSPAIHVHECSTA